MAIGVKSSVRDLIKVCGTRKKTGTDEFQIEKGLKHLGFQAKMRAFKSFAEFKKTKKFVTPAICCVDNYSHWVVLLGLINKRYIILDSIRGLQSYTEDQWKKRWQAKDGLYFAITFL